MTGYELARTFFPSTRKALIVETLSLLRTRAGEQRIKLGLSMDLGDGKLVGLPGWIGDALDNFGREDSRETAVKFDVELKEMTLTIFSSEDSQKAAQIAVAPLLNTFCLRRDPQEEDEEELSDINLHFFAYVNATTILWSWFYAHFRESIFTKFETTQAELPPEQKDDKQMKLGADEHEKARKEATSKEHDAEFADVGRTKGKAVTANA